MHDRLVKDPLVGWNCIRLVSLGDHALDNRYILIKTRIDSSVATDSSIYSTLKACRRRAYYWLTLISTGKCGSSSHNRFRFDEQQTPSSANATKDTTIEQQDTPTTSLNPSRTLMLPVCFHSCSTLANHILNPLCDPDAALHEIHI
jgi:hypothetical protein